MYLSGRNCGGIYFYTYRVGSLLNYMAFASALQITLIYLRGFTRTYPLTAALRHLVYKMCTSLSEGYGFPNKIWCLTHFNIENCFRIWIPIKHLTRLHSSFK